jgi:CRP/FNR family transcriptional regulator, nitrogen oxide reductase regulator
VKEGHVKAMVHAANGRSQTLCMMGAKGMFGSCCCFGGGENPCHCVAETDVTVLRIPMADFKVLLNKHPQASLALAAALSERLRHSKDDQTFEQERVEKRILHALVEMVKEFGAVIPLTKREIAEMAGTTVETCIRTFTILEAEGLLTTQRGRITVKNIQVLRKRLEAGQ